MKSKLFISSLLLTLLTVIGGCKKQNEWLEAKNSKSMVVPETLDDYQAILDDYLTINGHYTTAGLVGTDNYFLQENGYNSLDLKNRNLFSWQKDIWDDDRSVDWEYSYTLIEYSNIVLDGLSQHDFSKNNQYNSISGQAYFLRALAFYNLSQLFCKPYNAATATSDLGLPLRNTSNANILFKRSTLQQTYEWILSNLENAVSLLPSDATSIYRASKAAANALLAKTYLNMQQYDKALSYATEALKFKSTLMDFNKAPVDMALTNRFPASGRNNVEIIFYGEGTGYTITTASSLSPAFVDTMLMSSYETNDLRKAIYHVFDPASGFYKFRGTYTGGNSNFSGIAVNEILLLRAECLARKGRIVEALNDLNALLVKRFKTGTFMSLIDDGNILQRILAERRKELPFTANIRWEDLRRLNLEQPTETRLKRQIKAISFELLPNNIRYTLPIPESEIQLSHIMQNER